MCVCVCIYMHINVYEPTTIMGKLLQANSQN